VPLGGTPAEIPDPGLDASDPILVSVARLSSLLGEVHAQIDAGASPAEVLWTLWSGGRTPHGWSNRLRTAAGELLRSSPAFHLSSVCRH
jgi:hypothetical protein